MKREKLFKLMSLTLFTIITAILMAATIMEKLYGTEYALENIYCSHWMIALWGIATLSAIIYILQRKLQKQPVTLCLHLAFAVILTGALVTHLYSKQGQIHLRIGDYTNQYTLDNSVVEKLPFSITLNSFEVTRYAGSEAPLDFVSSIAVYDDERIEGVISMNNIFRHKGYRFYQSGYDNDEKGTFFSISYDPWGIGITYAGYSLLLLSMLLFLVQPDSRFRAALRKGTAVLLLTITASAANAQEGPQTLPKDVAEEFCNIHINYNDRICPLQTLAIDFTAKVYGKRSYKPTPTPLPPDTMAPELVLLGETTMKVIARNEFTDPGFTATDDRDGDLTAAVQIEGEVDVNWCGSYTFPSGYTVSGCATSTTRSAVAVFPAPSDTV